MVRKQTEKAEEKPSGISVAFDNSSTNAFVTMVNLLKNKENLFHTPFSTLARFLHLINRLIF